MDRAGASSTVKSAFESRPLVPAETGLRHFERGCIPSGPLEIEPSQSRDLRVSEDGEFRKRVIESKCSRQSSNPRATE